MSLAVDSWSQSPPVAQAPDTSGLRPAPCLIGGQPFIHTVSTRRKKSALSPCAANTVSVSGPTCTTKQAESQLVGDVGTGLDRGIARRRTVRASRRGERTSAKTALIDLEGSDGTLNRLVRRLLALRCRSALSLRDSLRALRYGIHASVTHSSSLILNHTSTLHRSQPSFGPLYRACVQGQGGLCEV
jgi:hypothetical protein